MATKPNNVRTAWPNGRRVRSAASTPPWRCSNSPMISEMTTLRNTTISVTGMCDAAVALMSAAASANDNPAPSTHRMARRRAAESGEGGNAAGLGSGAGSAAAGVSMTAKRNRVGVLRSSVGSGCGDGKRFRS